jgi:hypothetical protein
MSREKRQRGSGSCKLKGDVLLLLLSMRESRVFPFLSLFEVDIEKERNKQNTTSSKRKKQQMR